VTVTTTARSKHRINGQHLAVTMTTFTTIIKYTHTTNTTQRRQPVR